MQPILVGQSPHLPGSLQEALAEHHWLQRLPHRPRDAHWGLLIRKGSLLDLWDLYGHKRDKTDKDRD
jgi:hypothetical protein